MLHGHDRRGGTGPAVGGSVGDGASAPPSLCHSSLDEAELAPRPPLGGDLDGDVAIVGAGYTGLWTAYYLTERDPSLRIAVIEAATAGFGASGRNGGWCSALLPMGLDTMAASHGRDAAVRLQREMFATVDEVGAVATREGIDCHFVKGGTLVLARNPAHVGRLRAESDHLRSYGVGDDEVAGRSADEARTRLGATRVEGAQFTPHCASIHPARLARGLAKAVERRGVVIHDDSRVTAIEPHRLRTDRGTVTAEVIVRCTEAFTSTIAGHRRDLAPIYSLMVATEPLPASFFDEVGWADRSTFSDARRMVIYGQRTADDRIAFGGRGAPYHFASAMKPAFEQHRRVHDLLERTLHDLFPVLGDARVTHRWGGAVGVPRDWQCSVGFDRVTGLAWAGGYVGDGVGTTNLAGRTLADLITGTASDLVDHVWVGHRSPRWEPEPLRWIGITSMVRLPSGIDRYEERHRRPERWRSAIVDRLTGH